MSDRSNESTSTTTATTHQPEEQKPCYCASCTVDKLVRLAFRAAHSILDNVIKKSAIRIVHIRPNDQAKRQLYQSRIVGLEQEAEYSLGASDTFKIDHGRNYFAFFDRLGETHYYVALHGERVVAVGAGVLRHISVDAKEESFASFGRPEKLTWYLCDLKVHPQYRGRHLPLRILNSALLPGYKRSSRAYAISMNPPNGAVNRVVRLFERHSFLPVNMSAQLAIFSLDAQQMTDCLPLLEKHRSCRVSFLSLRGVKDLVLGSTGQPLPLLHAQFHSSSDHEDEDGEVKREQHSHPKEGYSHMFCAAVDDPLVKLLARELNLEPTATASILSYGLDSNNWNFILTSDI